MNFSSSQQTDQVLLQYDLLIFVQDYQLFHSVVKIIEVNFENVDHMSEINVHFPN